MTKLKRFLIHLFGECAGRLFYSWTYHNQPYGPPDTRTCPHCGRIESRTVWRSTWGHCQVVRWSVVPGHGGCR